MKKSRIIPFWMTPKAWFTVGDNRRLAKLDYEYEVESYDWWINKIKILHGHDLEAMEKAILRTDKKFEKISEYEYDKKMLELKYDKDIDEYYYNKASIEVEYKHGKIDAKEREKELATLDKTPWGEVNLVSDPENPDFGAFIPDYNEYWIEWLKDHGYEGENDNEVIDNYVNHICKYVAIENFDGVGDFSEKISESEIQSAQYIKDRTAPVKKKNSGGKTEYE